MGTVITSRPSFILSFNPKQDAGVSFSGALETSKPVIIGSVVGSIRATSNATCSPPMSSGHVDSYALTTSRLLANKTTIYPITRIRTPMALGNRVRMLSRCVGVGNFLGLIYPLNRWSTCIADANGMI